MDLELKLDNLDLEEILRYLEYRGQIIDDNLNAQIHRCIETVNRVAKPRYTFKEYILEEMGILPKELSFLSGEDIKKHIKYCNKIILFAATIGIDVERQIRIAGVKNVSDSVIMDSCASTLIEAVCDNIDTKFRLKNVGKYLTFRFSPGYGDLPISTQREFSHILDTGKKIGLNISESGIMIPRKSVTAIIGVSDIKIDNKKPSCNQCNNFKACRFLRRGVRCGR